ncbi:hypothetical protein WQ54_02155 [Bacillus sp. SA1-12]|uniref:fluoride efflux transporter CrcB n=1 Tax=Bacillus sp. SA1-12 TaxID=1455638 RepID=UPI000626EBC0|nr:fluoride efflux transporter CrcB [Bacillus sp. SA1-12]KKI93872.1 hypothetical protein WQ54_02155 [Bacillus sp. SA1-12]
MVSVMLGGALGAAARYLLGELLQKVTKKIALPLTIIIINSVGALMLGLFLGTAKHGSELFFITGFCGGFTTFSTFSIEAVQLIQNKQYVKFTLYVMLSIIGSISGILIGKSFTL